MCHQCDVSVPSLIALVDTAAGHENSVVASERSTQHMHLIADNAVLGVLDSAILKQPSESARWFDEQLQLHTSRPVRMALYHVPTYSAREVESSLIADVRTAFLPVFDKHNLTVAFENHAHSYKRTHPMRADAIDEARGTLYLGDGAWGVTVRDQTSSSNFDHDKVFQVWKKKK
jgi:hypothetical protein